MRPLRLAALALHLALPASAFAQGLQIPGGTGDLLGRVANSSLFAGAQIEILGRSPGIAGDGAPIPVAGTTPTGCAAAKSMAFHPNGRFVYVATDGGTSGNVCGYGFDAASGAYTALQGSPYRAGKGTRAVVIDVTGRFLYAANFDDGTITGFRIDGETGALTQLQGSPFVSTDANTKYLAMDPLGRFLYATNSDTNGSVSGFAIDRDNGQLSHVPFSPVLTPAFPGAVTVDPRGRYLYLAASPNQVYSIDQASGQLKPTGATFSPTAQGMDFDPTGRYLYASSGSGADSRLNAFRVDGGGTPTSVGSVVTGSNPLGVAVARTGRHVYTANLLDGNVSGFRIDDASGALTPIEGSPFAGSENMYALATYGTLAADETWTVNAPLARPVVVFGGGLPYSWAITQGNVPTGMTFAADIGLVSGTPTVAGTYPFTVRVTDAFGGTASKSYVFTVKGDSPNVTTVVEYYNATLDHYFITWIAGEIAKLDAGVIKGWSRTGRSFNAYIAAQPGASPICRYYIPPAQGDSHFFGRGTAECEATGASNPTFVLEDPTFMHMILPAGGTCAAGTTPVYRVFSNRPDANHRYTTDRAVRDAMVAKGWLAEGDGPDLVVMCAP